MGVSPRSPHGGSPEAADATHGRLQLSVLLTVRDEEEQLPLALGSVAGWADELVVVVDPRTTDTTREVAAAGGAVVLEHAFESSAAQCTWGLEHCRNDWVLVLDADERVEASLKAAIGAELASPRHGAYAVHRANFVFGRRVRFGDWGRDRIVRLLDRRRAAFVTRAVHGTIRATSVGHLGGVLEHHTLRSLDQYLPKVQDYAQRGAADLVARGRRTSLAMAVGRALWRLVRGLVLRLGFLDGGAGIVVAVLCSWGTFLKWALVWESRRQRGLTPGA